MDETSSATIDAPSPSSAPSSAPSGDTTPSTSAPTTDRPSLKDALTVFREAETQQGRRRSSVVPPSQDAATLLPEGTTAQVPPPVAQKPQGPIPFDVHTRSMDNARAKERATVEQEYQQKYGHPEVVSRAVEWFTNAARDRVGFLSQVISEAMADPQLAPQVASLVGRTLGSTRGTGTGRAPAPMGDQPPPPDFQDGQGNQFYSARAQQARDEWLMAKMREDILGEVAPNLETVQQLQQERQLEQQRQVVQSQMLGHLNEARTTWPQFREHEAEIKAALAKAPLTGGHPAEEAVLLQRIYRQIVGPKLDAIQQQKWIAELKSRANAGSINPSATGAPSGIPKNVRAKDGGTFANALKWAAAQQSGRG